MTAPNPQAVTPQELIAALLHELRQPLATALLDVEAAPVAAKEVERLLSRLHRTMGRMQRRFDTLAWLPDMLRGEIPKKQRKPQSVAKAVAAVVHTIPKFRVDIPTGFKVLAIPGTLELVLENLIGNAQKHAGADATITITARSLQDSKPYESPNEWSITIQGPIALLTVADNGPGIPPAFRPFLFSPFHKADPERPGMGIGLWLSRQLVRAHGGDLRLADTPEGACFVSLWPQAPGKSGTETAAHEEDVDSHVL